MRILDKVRKAQRDATDGKKANIRQQPHLSHTKSFIMVKIVTQIGLMPNSDKVYRGRIIDPYDTTGDSGDLIEPIVVPNEYRYFAGDLALVAYSSGGFRILLNSGRLYSGETSFGVFYST